MQDLQEVTQEIHYENFRSEKIATGNVARKIKLVDCFIVRRWLDLNVLFYHVS